MKKLIGLSLLVALLLTGCGGGKPAMQTPEETINTAFTALKELDMDTFNTCTNNKVVGGYRMLTDLFSNQDQEGYHQLAEAMVEHLSWEINNVEISEDTAVASVTIRNKDFSDTVGMFIGDLIQKVSLWNYEFIQDSEIAGDHREQILKDLKVIDRLLGNCRLGIPIGMPTVKELIAILSRLPEDYRVYCCGGENYLYLWEDNRSITIDCEYYLS